MAQTTNVAVTSAWGQVAEGPATVTLTAHAPDTEFARRTDAGAPAATLKGHALPLRQTVTVTVPTGTRIYARGRLGPLAVTVEVTA